MPLQCENCGATGRHMTRECPYTAELADRPKPGPSYRHADAYRRPESEVCPPERMHEIAEQARQALSGFAGPEWLRKRMQACQQVAESRRDPLRLVTQGYSAQRTVIGPIPGPNGDHNGSH